MESSTEFAFWGLNIWQILTIALIGLLFIKEVVIDFVRAKLGLEKGSKNGVTQDQINVELFDHARVANEEMGDVRTELKDMNGRMGNLEKDVSFIRGKLDN